MDDNSKVIEAEVIVDDEESFDGAPGSDLDLDEVGPLRGSSLIVLPDGMRPSDIIFHLSKKIPTNQYGLPEWFYRSDLLPPAGSGYTQDDLDACAVGLLYLDGYPTLDDGRAFWTKLPHEPQEAHLLFKRYIAMAEEVGIRQVDQLAEDENVELQVVQSYYREFYWQARARAHDLFITAAESRKRQFRIRKMENTHFDKAEAIMAQLLQRFEDPDWIEELTAKEAIESLEKLVKVQRLSVGLTGQHASSNDRNALPTSASTEVIFRQLVRGAGLSESSSENFGNKLAALFEEGDEGAMSLQEMVLRMNTRESQMTGEGAFDD